jgi:hypothetical protein
VFNGPTGGIGQRIPRSPLGLIAAHALRLRTLRLAAAAILGCQLVARHFSGIPSGAGNRLAKRSGRLSQTFKTGEVVQPTAG